MNATTRERLGGALTQLTDAVAALEALAGDADADLLTAERQKLAKAIEPLMRAIGPVAAISHQGEQRPPSRGKVTAAPSAPDAPQEAAAAPVAPVADRGVALGLRGLALAIRDAAMAARDHADALRELASSRPQEPPSPAPAPAPAPAARNRERLPGISTGQVAADLGVPMAAVQAQIRKAGGPAVGLTIGPWQLTHLSRGPSGKAALRWERIEAEQQAG